MSTKRRQWNAKEFKETMGRHWHKHKLAIMGMPEPSREMPAHLAFGIRTSPIYLCNVVTIMNGGNCYYYYY